MGFFSSLVGGFVGFLIGGPVGAVIGAGLGATKVGEKIVNSVMDFVLQPFMPKMPDMGDAGSEAQRQQGVLIQRQGSVEQIPVVYGYRKVGGMIAFAETGSTDNKYLYVAYVFCEGLVEGLREVYIDDWLLPVDQVGQLNAGNLVTVNADRYKDRVQLRWYPGVYFANPRTSTVGSTVKADIFTGAPSFTSEMVFNGMAVLFARYEWRDIVSQADADSNPFSGNIPELKVALLGKRVASLLVDSTETSSYESNPVRYSTNPAECLLDYLRNPRYGKGLINDDIDWTTWKAAARKCNQTVTYVASGIQGPILTLNEVVNTNTTLMGNVKNMLQNFRAYMPYVQGKYKLRIEDAGNDTDILSGAATIVATFTKDDIVSDVTYTGIEKSSKYNVVAVTYVDPDQKFSNQTVVYPESEAERQIYIDRDGGRENKYEVTMGGITNYAIAKDFARLIFNKQRRQESCVFTATSRALELEPGDCIRIQSNLLNFATDPWRVVSVKINNDMTVDLGCVRNPDDIYPYVRVGEEDIVLPTYVPKGSIIYFPSSSNLPPLGLVPPLHAVFPPVVTPTPVSPPPTDPTAPGGGGPGGGPDSGPPTAPPVVVVPPVNVPPVPVPPPPPFDAVLTFKSVRAPKQPNGNYLWEITFTQPTSALYAYSLFWWRWNSRSAWQEKRIDTRPGAGLDIIVSLGELPNGNYEFFARCFASDDRHSTKVTKGQAYLVESQSGAPGNFVAVGSAGVISASGWTLPPSDVPVAPSYDANIEWMQITPQLSGGFPLNPRRLKFKIQQIQTTVGKIVNMGVIGVDVYYRLRGDEYWSKESFDFGPAYVPGQIFESNLAGDFGIRNYPVDPAWFYTNANNLQKYEFVARLRYNDNRPAVKQLGPATGLVEWSPIGGIAGNPYNVPVWGIKTSDLDATGIPVFSGGATNQIITAQFNTNFKTTDQAPPGPVPGLDIVPSVVSISAPPTTSILYWRFNLPSSSKFAGFKIRYRPVLPGADPDFKTLETARLPDINNHIFVELSGTDYTHGQEYDFVVTAQVSVTGTGIVDATNSIVARAKVLFNDAERQNLYARFNFEQKTTQAALQLLQDAFPANPTVNVKSWNKIINKAWDISAVGGLGRRDLDGVGQPYYQYSWVPYLNTWYELRFQLPSSSTGLVLYRRYYDSVAVEKTTVTTTAKYNGLGPWERVYWSKASLTADAEGWYKVAMRGPIAENYFSRFYEVRAGSTLVANDIAPSYSPKFPNDYETRSLTGVRPYYGAGNEGVSSTYYAQYLFVIESSAGVEENKGLLLRSFNTYSFAFDYKRVNNGLIEGGVSPVIVNDINATYNTAIQNGYGRRLSEALSNTAFNRLHVQGYATPSSSLEYGYGTYNRFLTQPLDGTQVS